MFTFSAFDNHSPPPSYVLCSADTLQYAGKGNRKHIKFLHIFNPAKILVVVKSIQYFQQISNSSSSLPTYFAVSSKFETDVRQT